MCCSKIVSHSDREQFSEMIKDWKVMFDGTILCPTCSAKNTLPFDKKPLGRFIHRCKSGRGYFVSCGEE
jgi:hypothetical protein